MDVAQQCISKDAAAAEAVALRRAFRGCSLGVVLEEVSTKLLLRSLEMFT